MKGWSSSRGVLFSSNANNGTNAGLAYSNSNNTPSNTNTNIGSQLCLRLQEKLGWRPHLLVENFRTLKRVGRCSVVRTSKARSK